MVVIVNMACTWYWTEASLQIVLLTIVECQPFDVYMKVLSFTHVSAKSAIVRICDQVNCAGGCRPQRQTSLPPKAATC